MLAFRQPHADNRDQSSAVGLRSDARKMTRAGNGAAAGGAETVTHEEVCCATEGADYDASAAANDGCCDASAEDSADVVDCDCDDDEDEDAGGDAAAEAAGCVPLETAADTTDSGGDATAVAERDADNGDDEQEEEGGGGGCRGGEAEDADADADGDGSSHQPAAIRQSTTGLASREPCHTGCHSRAWTGHHA